MPRERSAVGELLTITVDPTTQVSARWLEPAGARVAYVFAHGAGAGMEHPLMQAIAVELAELGIATLRYHFPYFERGSRRPDPPPVCHATVRAAVAAARGRGGDLALFAGGRSFGGRMTSQAQAHAPLPGVRGLVFLGFPLHPAGKPAVERAQHLERVHIPMLFLQGTRDALADTTLITQTTEGLAAQSTLVWAADADHSFHVPSRSGRKDPQVRRELLEAAAAWMVARA